jgi:hypothetical protein
MTFLLISRFGIQYRFFSPEAIRFNVLVVYLLQRHMQEEKIHFSVLWIAETRLDME